MSAWPPQPPMWVHTRPHRRLRYAWVQVALGGVTAGAWWGLCHLLRWPGWALFLGYFAAYFGASQAVACLKRRRRA